MKYTDVRYVQRDVSKAMDLTAQCFGTEKWSEYTLSIGLQGIAKTLFC